MYSITIDLGGTFIKAGLICNGEITDFSILPAQAAKGLKANLPGLKDTIDTLLENNGISRKKFRGIGLAFPGLVNPDKGSVISTNEKYDDAPVTDLNEWVRENWDVPFFMDNDARLATIGEWRYGAARGYENMVMMTIGTGIGTGVVIEGQVLRGIHYQAGCLGGHFVVDYKGRNCTCGNAGCVEALSSSFFLPEIIKNHPGISAGFRLEAENMDFKALFALMGEGDADAEKICRECMNVWSAAIITYIHAYDPEIVVLGGGIMKSAGIILPYLEERITRLAWSATEKVRLANSELGDHAALLGLEYCLINLKRNIHNEEIFR